jgi:hypothetical protein
VHSLFSTRGVLFRNRKLALFLNKTPASGFPTQRYLEECLQRAWRLLRGLGRVLEGPHACKSACDVHSRLLTRARFAGQRRL